jgi:hypothetical protein
MYLAAMGLRGLSLASRLPNLLLLVLVGLGLSLNNTRAAVEALLKIPSPFERTPKFSRQAPQENPAYRLPRTRVAWLELLLCLYAAALLVFAVGQGSWGLAFWLALYAAGCACIAVLGFAQSRAGLRRQETSPEALPVSMNPNPGQD